MALRWAGFGEWQGILGNRAGGALGLCCILLKSVALGLGGLMSWQERRPVGEERSGRWGGLSKPAIDKEEGDASKAE